MTRLRHTRSETRPVVAVSRPRVRDCSVGLDKKVLGKLGDSGRLDIRTVSEELHTESVAHDGGHSEKDARIHIIAC